MAHAPPVESAALARHLAEALAPLPAAPPPPPSALHWRAELSLLGLTRLQCVTLTAANTGPANSPDAAAAHATVAASLGAALPRALRLVATAPGGRAGRAASALPLSLCGARWPAAARPAFAPLREHAAAAADLVPPARRPELLAAARQGLGLGRGLRLSSGSAYW